MNWTPLRPGDVVDVIAPASQCPLEKLNAGLSWLEGLGLVPRLGHNLIRPDAFFASDLNTQLAQLETAVYSDSKIIWCLRGGYGSMRLIPHMLKWKAPRRPKIFIGFSDVTSLHLFFNQCWNWPTLHGRVLTQLSPEKNSPDRRELVRILFGEKTTTVFKNLRPLNEAARVEKVIRGKISGGNLRIVQSSLGTPWEIQTKGKMVFFEDVGERGYSIDRCFEQLIQAKILDRGPRAVILGDFTEGLEKDGKDLSSVAMRRLADRVAYPVFSGLPCGHGEKNYALPFQTECVLETGKKGTLTCPTGSN